MASGSPTILDLLPLVFASPQQALDGATAVLEGGPEPFEASVAHQVIGIWQRDFGDLGVALQHLRRARTLAARSGSADREADVFASLGVALIHAGRVRRALEAFDRAVEKGTGQTLARVLYRRAYVWWVLGRHSEALDDLRRATPMLQDSNDVIWTARALTLRAAVLLAMGSIDQADVALLAAERLWSTTDQEHDKADVVEWRGLAAFRSGDIPRALQLLDLAARRYEALGIPALTLSIRRCEVLQQAGLAREALEEAETAIVRIEAIGGQQTIRADLLLTAARAANALGDAPTAIARSLLAIRLLTGQRRVWAETHARLEHVQALLTAGRVSGRTVGDASALAGRLADLGSPRAGEASLLAGRAALALGWLPDAQRHLAVAARARSRGPAFGRVNGWVAQALLAEVAGSDRAVLHACGRGLDLLDEHRMALGASELRAWATAQGTELAVQAQRVSLRSGSARRLLAWSERWRATALAVPATHPVADPELLRDQTALREITSRAEAARAAGTPVPVLEREQRRLEREIRSRTLHLKNENGAGAVGFDPQRLLDRLGETLLVEIAAVDGVLYALVCGGGRVRRFRAGSLAEAELEADYLHAGMRRLALQGDASRLGTLHAGARRLEELLFGAAAGQLEEGPVVLVPPARLHGIPWPLLPSLERTAFSVSPSAAGWLRACELEPPAGEPLVLVRGPGLNTGGAEIPVLSAGHPGALLLEEDEARVPAVLKAIDGAHLVHVAAHGTFRSDSPMFSSLRMADGPLVVHDFERLHRSPHRLVLSSCEAGRLAAAGADELLGLAAALLPLGTAALIASCGPVNDLAVVPLMGALHEGLGQGRTMAEALRDARLAVAADPVERATGWAFSVIGAG